MTLNQIADIIKKAPEAVIIPHVSTDGDGLGSSLALGLALKKLNKNAVIYLEEDIPQLFEFLPGRQMIRIYPDDARSFDTAIAVDTGDLERLGERKAVFNDARITVNIDHHCTNKEFAFYNYVKNGCAAVGEIIYQLMGMLECGIDTDIANCLYVALVTDTGGFRYSNTTADTHLIAADLIRYGIDVADISQRIFDTVSIGKIKLMGAAIKSLELLKSGKVAFITIDDDVLEDTGASEADCEGIVNIARNIRGVEVAAMFRQQSNGIMKVNLRSKSYADVAVIAGMFSGGGHRRAAGFLSDKPLNEIKIMLLKDIEEVLQRL